MGEMDVREGSPLLRAGRTGEQVRRGWIMERAESSQVMLEITRC